MPRPTRIPLFPLDVVLLPGMRLPLHIFEPRYKKMIGLCLRDHRDFGLILAATKAIATLGCTAEILEKTKDYSDGRMDIVTEGRAIFRLNELIDEKEYYEGDVEYVEDEPSALDPKLEAQLIEAFEQSYTFMSGRPPESFSSGEPATLAYRMASQLPMELDKRQALLEMRSESDRRKLVLDWITDFLPKLMELQRLRQRAGGNGHGPN
ncbi:MAG TPA: LON peptidase substrate-binding domain-containing protein [Candidatus Acidoferrales bacterium]|nr:LON peptidase substrate-binding domain-containing protein [Candidatus Acidoferrales bacterium]